MIDQHPLTDEIIIELIGDKNLFYCLAEDDMRTAADWQLEQVMEWGYKHLYPDQINALRKTMRPQQQEESRSNLLDSYITFNKSKDEIIRIDKQGFHYRGQFIEDAGEAHRLLVAFLRKEQEDNHD